MRLRRPSHGTVAAYLALFVALGGTSYAAASLPRHSVGTSQLRSHAVTNSKIKPGAVSNSRLANSSVTGSKVRNGSLTSADFKSGSAPQGPAGPAGPAGPQGPAGGGASIGLANVAANGTVNPATAVGLSSGNVRAVPGGYCFSGLAGTPRNVQVTPQNGFFGGVVANATVGQFGGCPTGTQVSVALFATSTNAAVNSDFFIEID